MPGFFDPLPGGDIIDFDRLKLWLKSQTISLQKIVANALNVATQGGGSVVADFDSGESQSFIDLAADRINITAGELTLIEGGSPVYTFGGTIIYDTAGAGTFDKGDYPGLRAIMVELVAGGGGAGGRAASTSGNASASSGGGAGSYGRSFILASALAASETVTIGAGGLGGAAGANPGNVGGISSFGSHVDSVGGSAGGTLANGNTVALLVGAAESDAGSNGDITTPGQGSDHVIRASAGSIVAGSSGGASHFSAGGRWKLDTSTAGPTPKYGAGGGGGGSRGVVAAQAGEDGADGLCLVHLYF